MFIKSDTDRELENLIIEQQDSLKLNFKNNFETQQKTLEIFLDAINYADFSKFKDTKLIWNIAGFINIISIDLKIIGQDLTFAQNEWQKRYYARQACLIIYESLNDLFGLMGKDFQKLINNKINNDSINIELNRIRTDLKTFKNSHSDRLKEIRNTSIAHKDNDIVKQILIIKQISWTDTIGLITQFDKILNDLGSLFQKLMNLGFKDFDELKIE